MLCMIMGLTPRVWAQDEPQPAKERTTHSAGFIVSASESQLFKVQEDSNAILYDAYFQRLTKEGTIEPSDSEMPTLRFSQSVDPLVQVGTVEQLHVGITNSAVSLMSAWTTKEVSELPSPTPCMQTIAGFEHSGDRYEIVDPQGESWRVECFVFEDTSGKGIGVIIKYKPDHETQKLCEDALNDLKTIPLEDETPYTKLIAGYPITLPVKSRQSDAKQLNPYAVGTTIQLKFGTLTIQLVNVPEEYDPKTTMQDQMKQNREELQKTIEIGSLHLYWEANSYIPVGPTGINLARGTIYKTRNNNGNDLFLARYAHLDGRIFLYAQIEGLPADSGSLNRTASILFSNARGSERVDLMTYQVPGFEFDVPTNLRVWTHDDAPLRDVYYISPFSSSTIEDRLEDMMVREPLTRVQFFEPGQTPELEAFHRALVEQLMNEYRQGDALRFDGDVNTQIATLDDGREHPVLWSTFLPQLSKSILQTNGFYDLRMILKSFLIESPLTGASCIVSTVSNEQLSLHADAITLAQIERLRPTETLDEFDLGFARVTVPRFAARLHRVNDNSLDDAYTCLLSTVDTEIEIFASGSSPRMAVLSSRLLASEHMPSKWRARTYYEEHGFFPKDANGLETVPFAGKDATFFEWRLEPMKQILGAGRDIPTLIRMYGFVHNDRFITIVMRQQGTDINPARMDQWVRAFHE